MDKSQQNIVAAAKGGSLKFLGIFFEYTVRFILGILLARWLGIEQYGLFNLAGSTFYLIVGLSFAGLIPALIRYVSLFNSRRDEAGVWGVIQVGSALPLLFSLVMAVGLFIFARPLAVLVFDEPRLTSLLQLSAVGLPFGVLIGVTRGALIGFKKMKYDIIAEDVGLPLLKLILVLILALTGLTAVKATLAHVIGSVITGLMMLYFLNQVFSLKRTWNSARRDFKEIVRFSAPVYGANLLTLVGDRLQSLLLGVLNTVASVGTFVAATQINRVSQIFYQAINVTTLPTISELHGQGDLVQLKYFYQTITKWTLAFNLPLFLINFLFAKQILSIFGEDFTTGDTGLTILAFGSLADAATGINNAMLTITGNTRIKTLNSFISVVLRLGLSFWLIPALGVVGAAIAIASATVVVNIIRTVEIFILFQMWPYNTAFIKPIVAGLVTAGAAYALTQWILVGEHLVWAGINICLLLLIYAGVTFLLGLAAEDRMILNRLGQQGKATWASLGLS